MKRSTRKPVASTEHVELVQATVGGPHAARLDAGRSPDVTSSAFGFWIAS